MYLNLLVLSSQHISCEMRTHRAMRCLFFNHRTQHKYKRKCIIKLTFIVQRKQIIIVARRLGFVNMQSSSSNHTHTHTLQHHVRHLAIQKKTSNESSPLHAQVISFNACIKSIKRTNLIRWHSAIFTPYEFDLFITKRKVRAKPN